MEFIEGASLRESSTRGTVAQAERVVLQAAQALSVAHAAGVIHRDIKPENIMVRPDGYVKVLDFGLARQVSGATITFGTGVVVGTLRYLSPEQARGESVGSASDVFSLWGWCCMNWRSADIHSNLTRPYKRHTASRPRAPLRCGQEIHRFLIVSKR